MPFSLPVLLQTCRISPENLKPGEVMDLVHGFGRLASWWLNGRVLERAASLCDGHFPRPALPAAKGSCWVIFAQDSPPLYPCLAEAYLLPLEWRPDTSHSERLPAKLIRLARSVAGALGAEGWGLHLSSEAGLADVALREADEHLEVESGWAALAGGLVVALDRGKPDPHVWATGRWEGDPPGIRPIGHLEAKVALASAYKARLFVPATQVADARRIAARHGPEDVQIGALAEGVADVRAALRAYRQQLRTPPGRSDPRADRRDYFLDDLDPEQEKDYYRNNLLPDIIEDVRKKWQETGGGAPVTHLVTIISDNPELAVMAAGVIRPTCKCVVLYTADKKEHWEVARKLLETEEVRVSCEVVPTSFESLEKMLEGMKERVRSQLTGAAPAEVVLDLTPGNKEMSIILALEAAGPGNRLYYLRHDRQGKKAVPFSERPLVRQVSGDGMVRGA